MLPPPRRWPRKQPATTTRRDEHINLDLSTNNPNTHNTQKYYEGTKVRRYLRSHQAYKNMHSNANSYGFYLLPSYYLGIR